MDQKRELQIVITARDEASKMLSGVSSKFDNLGANLRKSALAFSAIGAATTVATKGFIEAAGQMEATKTAFKVLIGDSQLAEKTLQQLFDLEKRTPFTIESVLTESKKLLAMGTSAKDLTKTLSMLGDVAAGVGFEKLPQLTLAFGQIQAKGRLMGTELRQLTEAGFNLADAMGVTHEKLEQMISDGEVGFEDVRKAFENVTGEGGRFEGLMDKLSQTTPGRLSTLESSIYKLQVAIGTALLPAVNRIIDAIIPAAEWLGKFATEHQTLTTIIIAAGLALGALGLAVLVLGPIIAGLAAAFSVLGIAIGVVGTILGTIVAILGGPVTIAIIAIGLIVAALALAWKNNWGGIQEKTKAVVEFLKGVMNWIKENFVTVILAAIDLLTGNWVGAFMRIKGSVDAVVGAIRGLINIATEMFNKVKSGNLKIPGFQHGGFVPGAYNQAVPAILHGGERVIPRNGVDVGGNSGGGSPITINMNGNVSMDSGDRVRQLAEEVVRILGRQNELAGKGLAI